MSDTDDQVDIDQHDDTDLGISDEDAERLLADAVDGDEDETDDSGSSSQRSRPGRDDRASDDLAKWKSLARRHERESKARAAKLREYEDANKTELQRHQDSAAEFKTRAEKAESALRRREIAEERAPAHATLAQIKAVAKRLAGDDDEAMETDADELFALLVPAAPPAPKDPPKAPAPTGRPKERLRPGSTDPEDDDEEDDPRRLAAAIRRNR